jgi:DNA-binding SARP family transcriptional activator
VAKTVSASSVLLHWRLSLLAYLCASHPPRLSRRDILTALLWPELDEAHARGSLRQELTRLRHALGAGVLLGDGMEAVGVDGRGLVRRRCFRRALQSASAGLWS